jgi:hypothetical protein
MPFASLELIRARDAAQRLLDHLGLESYLFEVEPAPEAWYLRVECAVEGGWRTARLDLDKQALLASAADVEIYRRLLEQWRQRLGECRIETR